MNVNDGIKIGAGLLVLWLVSKLFSDDDGDSGTGSHALDAFMDQWELFATEPAQEAMQRGKLFPYQLSEITAPQAARVAARTVALNNAPGTFNDDEQQALAAITGNSTYPELILFCEMFRRSYGQSVGPFVLLFVNVAPVPGIADDTAFIATVNRYLSRLRP